MLKGLYALDFKIRKFHFHLKNAFWFPDFSCFACAICYIWTTQCLFPRQTSTKHLNGVFFWKRHISPTRKKRKESLIWIFPTFFIWASHWMKMLKMWKWKLKENLGGLVNFVDFFFLLQNRTDLSLPQAIIKNFESSKNWEKDTTKKTDKKSGKTPAIT